MASNPEHPRRIAVVGCGTVGASFAALFLAYGLDVAATDPAPGAEDGLRRFVDRATTQLRDLGCRGEGRLSFHADLADALDGADFVQENAPEREDLKRRLLAEIDGLVPPQVIVASSTSALLRSRIIEDCADKRRCIIAHPFNPPHLMPLVEIVGEDADVVARAVNFFRALDRKPVVLEREMVGHIANRLTSALFREAVYLAEQGVASVADIDAAVSYGPGLRWAIMGPHMIYHLAGGEGGIAHYFAHLGPSHLQRWATLGNPTLSPEAQARIVEGVVAQAAGRPVSELEAERDRALIGLLRLLGRGPAGDSA
ncbi:MAG: 3-hydroxyacyl-CoA dehydrogenase NAD-binding domain-containing protein [Pseudomonadota bacterium]|nr:3-hydroxyacyl-CoA dehydrogenase NAD-binding domain-containing protein [Pseudomonadota bacterium]